MADEAVWPRPQIDASRIACPISRRSASSSSRGRTCDAGGEPSQQLLLADAADPARDALAARLVAEELGDPSERADQVGRLVEDHHDPGTERRADLARPLEGQRRVERLGANEHARRAAEQDGLDRPAARDSAGQVDEVAQGRAELDLVDAGPGDVAGQAEELRTGRAFRPDRGERGTATQHDERHVGQRLDVVDDGRLAEQPDLDREGRLVARLAALALDRLEQRRLLAADVGAGAAPELDVEGEARTQDVRAEEPGGARLADRAGDSSLGLRVLPAEVEVAGRAARGEGRDRHRLDDEERVALQQDAVLERAGFGLVGVADEVVGLCRLGRDGRPLAPGREGGSATAHQLGGGHLGDHGVWTELERAGQCLVAAVGAEVVERTWIDDADPRQKPGGVRRTGRPQPSPVGDRDR